MAVRVTYEDVQAIMENGASDVDETVIEEVYIVAANAVVNEAFLGDTTTPTAILKEIERWFTAHMIACSLQRTASEEEIMDARVKYTGYWGKKLESTSYGQMVLTLDTSGKMAKLGKGKVSMKAVKSFDD